LPLPSTSFIASVPATSTGFAPSAGEEAAKEERLPAASRMPAALVARATVKAPTAVSGAPAPSLMVRVATAPEAETEASEPPLGTDGSGDGEGQALEEASVPEKVASVRSTLPVVVVYCTARLTGNGV